MNKFSNAINNILISAGAPSRNFIVLKNYYNCVILSILIKFNIIKITNMIKTIKNKKILNYYICSKSRNHNKQKTIFKIYSTTRRLHVIKKNLLLKLKSQFCRTTYYAVLTKKGIYCFNNNQIYIIKKKN